MKNKKITNIVLIIIIVIALIAVSIVFGMSIQNSESTSFAYKLGKSTGQMARPYFIGLIIIGLILFFVRRSRKRV